MAQVAQAFTLHGWKTYHVYDSRRSAPGFPDLVCAHKRHGVLFIELKGEKGKLTKPQDEWLDVLGPRAYCFRPSDWDTVCSLASSGTLTGPAEAAVIEDADLLFGSEHHP